jgi:sugar phosphate permease
MTQTAETTYRYRWVILGVLWITYIVVFLNRLSVGPLAPFFKEDLSVNSAQVGLVMSAASLGYMVTLFPMGWVVDRIGARWPMVIGELIAGIAMMVLFFASSYTWLLVFMFITGIGCGCLMPSTTQSVIVWFPVKERATVMGFKQTAVNIGGIITAATLPAVALALGWRYGFLFLGITAIAIAVTALILYREPAKPSLSSTNSTASAASESLFRLLKERNIWLVAFCGLCLSWVEFTIVAHLVLYLTEALFFTVITAGGLLALAQVAGAIARPGGGLLSDRVFGGRRKPIFLLMAGTASATCLILGLFGSHLSWALYPVLFLLGLGGIGFGGIFLTLMSELGGRYGAGKAAGLGGTVAIVGIVFGPVVFGHIVDTSGSYELAWLSSALVAALCIVLLLFVKEEKKKI